MIAEWLENLAPHWGWLVLGAALVTGLLALLLPVGLSWQVALFAALAVAAVLLGRRWLRANPIVSPDPLLNDRGGRLVGDTVVVTRALAGGEGRVRHGDSEWLARGPDAEPGTSMRIVGHDGAVLLVEHLR
jgi:membrane protein implicated in regulation of membrane protease activity